jgi:putative ABC transport system substrate-binding protein
MARGQQGEHIRHIAVFSGVALEDVEFKARMDAFSSELQRLGWKAGRETQFDLRYGGSNAAERRKKAVDLVALVPDVILAIGSASLDALLEATRAIPIVFTVVADPVGAGYVESLAQPGGSVTGFMLFDYNLSGKWLELLKEITPGLKRAGVLRESNLPIGIGQFAVIQAVAPSLSVDVHPIGLSDPVEVERGVAAFARNHGDGLVVTAGPSSLRYRDLIIALAAQHKLPAVYYERLWAGTGGLISYGPNFVDQHRQAATYVDRILKGEKPAELPNRQGTRTDHF